MGGRLTTPEVPWVPLELDFAYDLLPQAGTDRSWTDAECTISLRIDRINRKKSCTVSGYAKLWRVNRKGVRRILEAAGLRIDAKPGSTCGGPLLPAASLAGTGPEQQEDSKAKYNQQLKPQSGTAAVHQADGTGMRVDIDSSCNPQLLDYVKRYVIAMSLRKDIGNPEAYTARTAANIISRGGLSDRDWNYLNKLEGKHGQTADSSSGTPGTGIAGSGSGGACDIDGFILGLDARQL